MVQQGREVSKQATVMKYDGCCEGGRPGSCGNTLEGLLTQTWKRVRPLQEDFLEKVTIKLSLQEWIRAAGKVLW